MIRIKTVSSTSTYQNTRNQSHVFYNDQKGEREFEKKSFVGGTLNCGDVRPKTYMQILQLFASIHADSFSLWMNFSLLDFKLSEVYMLIEHQQRNAKNTSSNGVINAWYSLEPISPSATIYMSIRLKMCFSKGGNKYIHTISSFFEVFTKREVNRPRKQENPNAQ